jgi:hypothetical protein
MAKVKNTVIEREYAGTPNKRNFAEGMINWANQYKCQTTAFPNMQIV